MPRILIIDDSPTVRSTLEFCLQNSGFEVTVAPDGAAGLAKLAANDPRIDLVLVDYNMPLMDGIAVCRSIRSKSDTEKLPVVLMTGYATKETLARAQQAGFQDVLTKPFVIASLVADLRRHLVLADYEPASARRVAAN